MNRIFAAVLAAVIVCGVVLTTTPASAAVGAACSGTKLRSSAVYASSGMHLGRVELWYRNGQNCVQTITAYPGRAYTRLGATLIVGTTNNPRTATTDYFDIDSDWYRYYAGGVWLSARNRCVRYAGDLRIPITTDGSEYRSASFISPWTACG